MLRSMKFCGYNYYLKGTIIYGHIQIIPPPPTKWSPLTIPLGSTYLLRMVREPKHYICVLEVIGHPNHSLTKSSPSTTLQGTNPSPTLGSSEHHRLKISTNFREDMWSFRSQEGYYYHHLITEWAIFIVPLIYHCYSPCPLGGCHMLTKPRRLCPALRCDARLLVAPAAAPKMKGSALLQPVTWGRNGSPGKSVQS